MRAILIGKMEFDLEAMIATFNGHNFPIVKDQDGNEWFKANPVAAALGYARPKKAVHDHVKSKHKRCLQKVLPCSIFGYHQGKEMYMNEPGLYKLIAKCSMPAAEVFEDWVYGEVLPAIRKRKIVD